MTDDLQVGIGDALSTDYLLLRNQLTNTQLDYLARARRFVDEEVLPTINDYWDRAESRGRWSKSSARPGLSATASPDTAARPWTRCPQAWSPWSSAGAMAASARSWGSKPGSPCRT
jgi:hypothetical protein